MLKGQEHKNSECSHQESSSNSVYSILPIFTGE